MNAWKFLLSASFAILMVTGQAQLLPLRSDNGKYGFVDQQGNWVIDPIYDNATIGYHGVNFGFLDKQFYTLTDDGKEIKSSIPDVGWGTPSENTILFCSDDNRQCELLDKQGNQIIAPGKYQVLTRIGDGYLIYMVSGDWGMIDEKGNEVLPAAYDVIHSCSEGLVAVQNDAKCGVVDLKGNIVVPLELESGAFHDRRYSEGLILFEKGYKMGFMDRSGKVVVEPIHSKARPFKNGLAEVVKMASMGMEVGVGLINKKGELIVPQDYNLIDIDFKRGIIAAQDLPEIESYDLKGNKFEPKTIGGKQAVAQIRDLYVFKEDDLFGVIDKSGKVVVAAKHYSIFPMKGSDNYFYGNYSRVSRSLRTIYDQNGKEIVPDFVTQSGVRDDGVVWFKSGERKGYISTAGKVLMDEITYDQLFQDVRTLQGNEMGHFAVPEIESVVYTHPKMVEAWKFLGKGHVNNGDIEKGYEAFKASGKLATGEAAAVAYWAQAYKENNVPDVARKFAELMMADGYWQGHLIEAQLAKAEDSPDWKHVIARYDKAFALMPEDDPMFGAVAYEYGSTLLETYKNRDPNMPEEELNELTQDICTVFWYAQTAGSITLESYKAMGCPVPEQN